MVPVRTLSPSPALFGATMSAATGAKCRGRAHMHMREVGRDLSGITCENVTGGSFLCSYDCGEV